MESISRYFNTPNQSFFLFGPRGTGKSTWSRQHFKDAIYVDLLFPENFRKYMSKPERLEEMVLAYPSGTTFILDEIQKIPELLSSVHRLIELKKDYRFVLTGSSARKLKRKGIDLLAGRALNKTFHPFIASELKDQFDLQKALQNGLIPLIWNSPDPQQSLNAYVTLYLKEEVQQEGLVRNLGNFSRFLEILSFSHASLINRSHISRESEIENKTVEGYFSIVEDLLLGYRIPVFSKKAKRALVSHQKFYYFDSGLYRVLRPKGPLDEPQAIEGCALEGLVAQHLRAWADFHMGEYQLYFWRTQSGSEIDFIVYSEKEIIAIEVKNSKKVHPQDVRALQSFMKDYPSSKAYLLYRGNERMLYGNVHCIPCEDFLKNLIPGKTMPS